MDTTRNTSEHDYIESESSSGWLFDAFNEPRTYPSQWDLSELKPAAETARKTGATPPAPKDEFMDGQVENEDAGAALHITYLNPLAELRKYPLYWDLRW